MSSEVRSYTSFSLHTGDDSQVLCHHYADRAPILVIDGRGCSVTVSTGLEATGTAVEFARALARKAQEFADDIERQHAARHADAGSSSDDDGTTKADESKAA
jgi:hypothetical protein